MTMLRIESLTLREITLTLKEPFRISSGTQSRRRILLVELRGADGEVGWGECAAGENPNYSSETPDTAWIAITEWVAPRVLGRSFASPEEIHPVLEENFRGHNMAKAAVEMAAWEMTARKEGVSLSRKLGGTRERIRVGISLGIQESPEALVAKARAALERGYRKVKIKIKPGADVEYVRAAREELGPEAPLMVDANNAYTLADTSSLEAMDGLGLMMFEQPLAWDDLLRHVELQRRLKTPVCLDESITNVDRAEDMIALGAGRIVNVKPGRVGGFTQSRAIHDVCEAAGIPVWCGGMLESGIGRAHNVALASLPNFKLPGDVSPSERYWERDIVIPEWTMDREGWIDVPVGEPGMGVRVDLDRVEDLTIRRADLPAR
jgi:O-succinylbenzoate synthase